MKCPKCQYDNREGTKFCLQCGGIIELRCPRCGESVPLSANYCDYCGQRLDEPLEKEIIPITESGRKRVH
jgi:uncharacterized OB-fold protein